MRTGTLPLRSSLILASAIGLLVTLIMLLILIGGWRWDRTLQDGLITLDLISRSQQESAQTSALVERILSGDRSVSSDQALARLGNLRIYSLQLSEPDTQLLDMRRTRSSGPQLQEAVARYQREVEGFATLLQQRLQMPERVRFLDLRRQARHLEQAASQLERLALEDIRQARSHQRWLDAGNILLVGLLSALLLALLGYFERQRNRAFSQLTASEARLRAFTESLPEVSFLFDRDGNYLEFYGTAHDRLYAPAEQLRDRNIADVLPESLARTCLALIQRTLDTGMLQNLCYELEINGQPHYFEARLAPLTASAQVAWISWDITQRQQAEQRVQELSQMYGLLSATSQAIVRCDTRDGLFASLCRSALEQQLFTHASIQPLPASQPDDWPDELWQRLHSGVPASLQPRNGDVLPASLQAPELACWFGLPLGIEHPPALLLQLGSTSSGLDRSEIHLLLGELQENLEYALQRFAIQQLASQQRRRLDLQAAALESSQDAILITDLEHRILLVNQAFCLRTGHARAECLGGLPLPLAGIAQSAELTAELQDSLAWSGAWHGEVSGHDSNGTPLPCLLSVTRVSGRGDTPGGFIYIFTDLRRIKQAEEQVTTLTWFDSLTGLPNATRLWLELDERLYREQTEPGHTAVLFLNLNDFHSINDAYGHACGDALLQAVGQRLVVHLGEQACIGRQSSDIFIALVPASHAAELPGLATGLQQAFEQPFLIDGHELFVSFSAGLAISGQDGDAPSELLQRADAALHDAHQSGRGHWRCYNTRLGDQASQRLSNESLLRRALQLNLFELYYQPLLDCQTGEMHGAEALVRLRPEAGCSMGPAEFIPLLEQSGLILQLGEWVQREACRQCRQWLDEGLNPGVIAINLSPVEIQEGRVHDQLQAILVQTGLPAQHIELEVTESGLLAYGSQAAAFLQRLHDLGVRLAIDDFGTGYSSLAYLKRFPVHKLKIDRSFVRDLPDDPVDSQLTSTIISLARSLDLKVLAEGVETEAQRELLAGQGCDYWQGYLASRPLPASEFSARFLTPPG